LSSPSVESSDESVVPGASDMWVCGRPASAYAGTTHSFPENHGMGKMCDETKIRMGETRRIAASSLLDFQVPNKSVSAKEVLVDRRGTKSKYSQIHPIRRVKIRASSQPLRGKSHPA
jgi:hypothetical protein